MCTVCFWDKKKNVCTEPTCGSFTSMGPYKCDKNGKKFNAKFGKPDDNGDGIAGPCHWDVRTDECTDHMPTEDEVTCADYFEKLGKKGCKKLGKPYIGCNFSTNFKICLAKGEEVSCPTLKKTKCKGRCVFTKFGGCLDKAEYECKDLGQDDCTENHRAKLIKKGCVWQKGACFAPEDLATPDPTAAPTEFQCSFFDGSNFKCTKKTPDGVTCVFDKASKLCTAA